MCSKAGSKIFRKVINLEEYGEIKIAQSVFYGLDVRGFEFSSLKR